MKTKAIIAAIAAGATLPTLPLTALAQEAVTEETVTTTTTTFTPEARTKVVEYFDTYRTQPYGLPPTVVERVQIREVPTTWKTTTVAPGYVIAEPERRYLVPAPRELNAVLPAVPPTIKYYLMGRNIVAVDTTTMRIVDSLAVSSIKYDDDGEIEIKDGDVEIKIEEDGEVEIKDGDVEIEIDEDGNIDIDD
ncbi:hypothetical protein BH23VER1_BH23VER1_06930 [soil metagenome]